MQQMIDSGNDDVWSDRLQSVLTLIVPMLDISNHEAVILPQFFIALDVRRIVT